MPGRGVVHVYLDTDQESPASLFYLFDPGGLRLYNKDLVSYQSWSVV